jgi:glycosyltransferase involved in cell wall biosynthesis
MYPLDRGLWGPTVRITHVRDALGKLAELEVVSGWRGPRARALWRYWRSGRLAHLDGIYVESSTFLPGPADLAFLGRARRRGLPVLTYIRDAYQLFPEYADRRRLKSRISARLFVPAFRALARRSTVLAYPTRGLADALPLEDRPTILLPPGAPPPRRVARNADADQILHVGSLRQPVLGGDILYRAVERARADGHRVGLTLVARPGDEPEGARPRWVEVRRAAGDEIDTLLPRVLASVVPRLRTPYNDIAVPIKVMEYLSYGRPMITTDCTETARIVHDAGSGLVVADGAAALAQGISELAGAAPAVLDQYAAAGHRAALEHSWDRTGQRVVETILGTAG